MTIYNKQQYQIIVVNHFSFRTFFTISFAIVERFTVAHQFKIGGAASEPQNTGIIYSTIENTKYLYLFIFLYRIL